MKNKQLTIATYNIQFGFNREEIIENVVKLAARGTDVVCLQEVINVEHKELIVDTILKRLGKRWNASYNVGKEFSRLSIGTCIFWNTEILRLKHEEKIFLPRIKEFSLEEKFFYWVIGVPDIPLQRRATSCVFNFDNTSLRITCVHIDNVGGAKHRMKQVTYLLSELHKSEKADKEVICGDFNTFDLLKIGYEIRRLQKKLGKEYIDSSKRVGWTSDIYNLDFTTSIRLFPWFIKAFHIHVRRRLDYIWVKHMKLIDCKKEMLPGSDHVPVVATVEV